MDRRKALHLYTMTTKTRIPSRNAGRRGSRVQVADRARFDPYVILYSVCCDVESYVLNFLRHQTRSYKSSKWLRVY